MDKITRREFVNGMSAAAASSYFGPGLGLANDNKASTPSLYPPLLTGMRGSHPGSFEVAHAIRDGAKFRPATDQIDERYDLIVVGAGISGLAAATFYSEKRPGARVLLLDTKDDFGGHAKRNEFLVDGHKLVGYGGTQSIESPHARYGGSAGALLHRLGINFEQLQRRYDLQQYVRYGMTRGIFFKEETFGVDKLVRQPYGRWVDWTDVIGSPAEIREFVSQFPISAISRDNGPAPFQWTVYRLSC